MTALSSYWLSSHKMTVSVDIDGHGFIVDGAPVIQKFKGQPFGNLVRWMQKQGGFKMEQLGAKNVADPRTTS